MTRHVALNAPPTVVHAGRFYLDDRGHAVRYLTQRYHAVHLYDYAGTMRLDGRVIELRPGDVTLTPAGVAATYDLPRPGHHLCIHFTTPRGRSTARSLKLPLHVRLGERAGAAEHKLLEVIRCHAMAAAAGDLAGVTLHALLLWLRLEHDQKTDRAAERATAVDRAVDYIEGQLGEPLSAARVARAMELSPDYLTRLFKQRTGRTLSRYILERRIERAKLMLRTTTLPVKVIAARVGIADPHYFNKQFRRVVGCAPSRARG